MSAQPPSIPVPETAARRAALTREIATATGLDDATLERLVRRFYAVARQDAVLGPLFDNVDDWEAHISKICAFWSSVGLMTGRYHGNPLGAHLPLALKKPHFLRWLELFEKTATENCTEAGAAHLLERARRIAQSLELGIAVSRGEIPVRSRPG